MKINDAEDAKKAQSAVVMKEFLKIENIVAKEQPSQQEQELINSIITKKEESDSSDKNAAILCTKSSFDGQVESSKQEVQTVKNKSYSSTKTDVSGCVSIVLKKNDKEFPSAKRNGELISIYGSLIFFYSSFLFITKVLSKCLIFKLYCCFKNEQKGYLLINKCRGKLSKFCKTDSYFLTMF